MQGLGKFVKARKRIFLVFFKVQKWAFDLFERICRELGFFILFVGKPLVVLVY